MNNNRSDFFKSLVYVTLLLLVGGYLFAQYVAERKANREIAADLANRDQQIAVLLKERDGYQQDLDDLQAKLDTTLLQYEQAAAAAKAAGEELTAKTADLTRQQTDLTNMTLVRDTLAKKVDELNQQVSALTNQLHTVTAERDSLQAQVTDLLASADIAVGNLPIPLTGEAPPEAPFITGSLRESLPWMLGASIIVAIFVYAMAFVYKRKPPSPRPNGCVYVTMTRQQFHEYIQWRRDPKKDGR